MSDSNHASAARWWAMIVLGTGAALLIAWLARVTGVPLATLLTIGVGALALAWLVVLVAVPWNLYFAARQVVAEQSVSRGRGIVVRPAEEAEAGRIARRMLWFALGGHAATAAAAVLVSEVSGNVLGYYAAVGYLLSIAIRPAVAYFSHLRERIRLLTRHSTHPRDDVVTLQSAVESLTGMVRQSEAQLRAVTGDLRGTEARLADAISHARQLLTADLARVQDAQAADRESARTRDEELGRRIDKVVRRIEDTLDGISDHQELQVGLRALVRMIRTDAGLT